MNLQRIHPVSVQEKESAVAVHHAKVFALWSLVHGLSTVVTIKGAINANHLDEEVERILISINV